MSAILKKYFAAWLLLACVIIPLQANAAMTIDGSATNSPASTSTPTVTLSTTLTNDVIILFAKHNSGTSANITSVSDTAGLTWTKRKQGLWNGTNADQELWYAVSSSALTSDVITATFGASVGARLTAFGINGANTGTPFDSNVSLPGSTTSATSPTAVSINTTNANDMIITQYVCGGCTLTSRPSGFTQVIATGSVTDVAYEVVSSAQTGLSVSYSVTTPNPNAMIVDAVQQAATAATQPLPDTSVPMFRAFP